MKLDVPILLLLIAAVFIAAWKKPWVDRIPPEREEILNLVLRVGRAMDKFREEKGFYPRLDSARPYSRHLLGGIDTNSFLFLRDDEKELHLRAPAGEDPETSMKVDILDPLGNKLIYKYPANGDTFVLYSVGVNGKDEGGAGDDVSYPVAAKRSADEKVKEIQDFVHKVGSALVTFRKRVGFYPRSDDPTHFGRYILGGWRFRGYLDFTPEEKQKYVKVPEGEDIDRSNSVQILDPLGQPLIYRRATLRGPFQLYSIGPDGIDDSGGDDDVSYHPPHFNEAYWHREQRKAWKWLGMIGALILARVVWLVAKRPTAEKDEEEPRQTESSTSRH